jgi:hypothetical protein
MWQVSLDNVLQINGPGAREGGENVHSNARAHWAGVSVGSSWAWNVRTPAHTGETPSPEGAATQAGFEMKKWICAAALAPLASACAASPQRPDHAARGPEPHAVEAAVVFASAAEPTVKASTGDDPGAPRERVADRDAPPLAEMPSECAREGAATCTPPAAFVERLCSRRSLDVALAMFRKGTPWRRAYVRGDLEAWYAGARRTSPKQLRFAEEVLIVADRSGSASDVKISGSASYDVYRWDGSCVSLMQGELTFRAPGVPVVANIPWLHLDEGLQNRLASDRRINYLNDKRRKACKAFGDSSLKQRCDEAKLDLSLLIADYVRRGGKISD